MVKLCHFFCSNTLTSSPLLSGPASISVSSLWTHHNLALNYDTSLSPTSLSLVHSPSQTLDRMNRSLEIYPVLPRVSACHVIPTSHVFHSLLNLQMLIPTQPSRSRSSPFIQRDLLWPSQAEETNSFKLSSQFGFHSFSRALYFLFCVSFLNKILCCFFFIISWT